MKRIRQYFLLEMKKIAIQFPKLLIGSFLLLAVTSACLFLFQASASENEKSEPISIGVLAEKDEPFIDWIIQTANNMPDMGYAFQAYRIDENTAKEFLSNERNVLFLVPKNYISSIIEGKNEHLTIRFSKSQTNVVNTLMKELASAASSYILDTEAAIYSMQDYYKKYGLPDAREEELKLNIRYLQEIISFTDAITEKAPDLKYSSSLAASCLSAGITLLPLIFSLLFAPVMTSENPALKNQLNRLGLHLWKQILIKELAFLLAIFTIFSLLFFLLFPLKEANLFLSEELLKDVPALTGTPYYFFLLFQSIPVFLFSVSFSLLFYKLAEDASGGIFLLFFSTIFMALFSGLFYPLSYLPGAWKKISAFSPLAHGNDYLLHILYKTEDHADLLFLLLSSVICYLFTVLLQHKKCRQ